MCQRVYSMGCMFGRFMKWVIPLNSRNVLPLLNQAATSVVKKALVSVAHISKDALIGKPIKETNKENANSVIDNLKSKAEHTLGGNGIKRSRSMKK